MKFKENLYQKLPPLFQDISLAFESERIARRRYSAGFHKILQEISKRDKLSKDELQAFQIKSLRHNLINSYEHTGYYHKLFDQHGFDPHCFNNIEELLKLPLQDKTTIKNNFPSIINQSFKGKQFQARTSGTSGSGFVFPETVTAEHYQWSTWWRYRKNLGIELNSWCSVFGGRTIIPIHKQKPPFWKILPRLNQISYSMYHLNSSNARYFIKDMNQRKVEWIHGYPSTLSSLASLMKEQNVHLDFPLKIITTGAENLLDHQRIVIYEVFGVEPYQHYGLSEPVANISECEYHKLHIDEDYSLVELLVVPGSENKFRLVGTSISNEILLFLRYDTGDIVTLADDQSCPCGRNGRIVESIDGRREDFITLSDGTRIGRLDHIFKDQTNVVEAQIRQEKSGRIVFCIVKNQLYATDDERRLISEIKSRLGFSAFEIIYSDHIEKTSTGKLRFVIAE
ncbi:MAG: hypothetical protein WCP32_11540 [Bacteroidota bacterium]